jgi:alanine dehydrogenase
LPVKEPLVESATRVLTRTDVERLLDVRTCAAVVEEAFRQRGQGRPAPSAVLGVHAGHGGFHAKAGMLQLSRPWFVTKVNANFPGNPATFGLPTIQGVLVLFDAACGRPLAVMDAGAITTLRTAAASAVAASYLARGGARTATVVGCGVQARAHIAALREVCPLDRLFVLDVDAARAERFAAEMRTIHAMDITVGHDLGQATRASEVIVTCTSSTKAFLAPEHVSPGAFIAAVGADNEQKHEIDTLLLRSSAVIVDDLDQCAAIGDLHHAMAGGAMHRGDVRATLDEVVAGQKPGRRGDDEIVIFDSTGVAIEDVAAAAVTYERALQQGVGIDICLAA